MRAKVISEFAKKKQPVAALAANTTPNQQCKAELPPSPKQRKVELPPSPKKRKRPWGCKVELPPSAWTESEESSDEEEEEESEEEESSAEEEEDSLANGPRGDSARWFLSEV